MIYYNNRVEVVNLVRTKYVFDNIENYETYDAVHPRILGMKGKVIESNGVYMNVLYNGFQKPRTHHKSEVKFFSRFLPKVMARATNQSYFVDVKNICKKFAMSYGSREVFLDSDNALGEPIFYPVNFGMGKLLELHHFDSRAIFHREELELEQDLLKVGNVFANWLNP